MTKRRLTQNLFYDYLRVIVDTDGNVTKVGVGECEITATCNNTDYAHSATCKVTVS